MKRCKVDLIQSIPLKLSVRAFESVNKFCRKSYSGVCVERSESRIMSRKLLKL